MKHQYSSGIIIYKKENNTILYLLLRYSAGHWDFPKGKIEAGETKEEAALRELKEETNLTAQIDDNFEESLQYIFSYNRELTQKTVYFFTGQATSTEITLSHEHTDFTWLPYQDALAQLTYDNAKEVLKKANEHNLLVK
jgi:mutator protein MutT